MNDQSNSKPMPDLHTLEECANLPPAPTEPYVSSPWEFDAKSFSLDCFEQASGGGYLRYSIPLAECSTPQGILSWFHRLHWTGATPDVVGALYLDLDLFLDLETICKGGGPHNVKDMVRRRLLWAKALRGKRPTPRPAQKHNRITRRDR